MAPMSVDGNLSYIQAGLVRLQTELLLSKMDFNSVCCFHY